MAWSDPAISATAGALLIAGINELRARSRARTADLDHERRARELEHIALAATPPRDPASRTRADDFDSPM
jgi:hypothetical protein